VHKICDIQTKQARAGLYRAHRGRYEGSHHSFTCGGSQFLSYKAVPNTKSKMAKPKSRLPFPTILGPINPKLYYSFCPTIQMIY